MQELTVTLEIVTPLFLGGADPCIASELRLPAWTLHSGQPGKEDAWVNSDTLKADTQKVVLEEFSFAADQTHASTVATETGFRFAVGWRTPPDAEALRLQDLAREWLIGGLTRLGAGAKTSAGYGYFQSPPPAQPFDAVPQVLAVSQTDQPAPAAGLTSPAPTSPATSAPSEGLVRSTGMIREYQPGPGRGRLVDDETGEEFRFSREAIAAKGWSSGKKHRVCCAVVQREGRQVAVKVKRN